MTNKVPNIRFKGFTDDWEQRKVSEVTTSYSGGTPQAGNSEYYNGTIPFIRSGEIYENHTELFITQRGLENSSAKMVSKGDILYALYGATSGEVSRSNIDGAINQAILAITPNDGYNANFLVEWFRKEKASIINKYLQGGQGNLSAQIIKKLEIPLPTFKEQDKIGRYFTEINRLITLHQRKLFEAKNNPKNGSKNFFRKIYQKLYKFDFNFKTYDWEQRKLESLCEVFTDGDWIEAKDQSNSGVRLIQTGNVGITEYLDKENNKKWISEETLKRLRCEEVYPGDILISRLPDPAGRACILPNLGIRMITAVDCTIIRTSKEYDSKYLVQYLSTPTYFKIVNSFLGGGTRQRISRKNLSKIDIPVPHIFAEQQKIGEYFSNLDHLITLHQREVFYTLKHIFYRCCDTLLSGGL